MAAYFLAAAFLGAAFFAFAGLDLPKDPFEIFPFFVFASPRPIRMVLKDDESGYKKSKVHSALLFNVVVAPLQFCR